MITAGLGRGIGARLHQQQNWALSVALGAASVVGVYLAALPNGDMGGNRFDNVTEAGAAVLAGVRAALAATTHHAARRLAWSAMALGGLACALGQVLVTGDQWNGGSQSFPGPPDVGFLLFPIACLALLPRSIECGSPFCRRALDGAVITVALLVAGWATLKRELRWIHGREAWNSGDELRCPLFDRVECSYNPKRSQELLGYRSPADHEEFPLA